MLTTERAATATYAELTHARKDIRDTLVAQHGNWGSDYCRKLQDELDIVNAEIQLRLENPASQLAEAVSRAVGDARDARMSEAAIGEVLRSFF